MYNYTDNITKMKDLYNYIYPDNLIVRQPQLGTWLITINGHHAHHDVTVWGKGIKSKIYKEATDIANKLVKLVENPKELKLTYNDEDSIKEKIFKISTKIYGAQDVEYSEEANKEIEKIEKLGYGKLPVCIAKTQYSFSDDPKNLECNDSYNIHVRNVELKSGAGFIVVLAGKIMTMPGLPKVPAAENIDIDEKENIVGIF